VISRPNSPVSLKLNFDGVVVFSTYLLRRRVCLSNLHIICLSNVYITVGRELVVYVVMMLAL